MQFESLQCVLELRVLTRVMFHGMKGVRLVKMGDDDDDGWTLIFCCMSRCPGPTVLAAILLRKMVSKRVVI